MRRDRLAALLVIAITAVAFSRTIDYPFLNWDDQEVFVRNEGLRTGDLASWAFTTRYMEHYQPLAWITWGSIDRTFGLDPASAHALNVVLHAICAMLVFACGAALQGCGGRGAALHGGAALQGCEMTAGFAALLFAIHPLRVEPVAWASAMPYSLALMLALLAALAWSAERSWLAAIGFALSLLARPIALALPLVLWLLRRPKRSGEWLALGAMTLSAVIVAFVESSARLTTSLAEFGAGPRLTLAATAPWRYLWKTVWPSGLTPLDPLSLNPRTDTLAIILGSIAIVLVSAAAWRWRREYPVLAGAWVAYLALLAPAMGLLPSGLQATADRYSYFAAVAISIAVADGVSRSRMADRGSRIAFVVAIVASLAAATWQQTGYWRDSVTLWTRAVDIDPSNDVALYNLGAALAESDHRDEAIARYEQVLAIVPAHAEARRNRDLLVAQRLEEEANALAGRRDLAAAADRYAAAVKLDPQRTHSQAALGMALLELGRVDEARPHLRAAIDQGAPDAAVANALAFVLMRSGDEDAALAVLRQAQQRHPADENIARNLAMLEKKKGGP